MLSELKSFHRIICPDLRGMGRSHSLDFIDRPVTVDEVVEDVHDGLVVLPNEQDRFS